jgi:ribosomal protein S18 acetylase RimI-like enzyme
MKPHIRRARLGDAPFIRQLSLEAVPYGIPEGRDISNEAVIATAAEGLKNLEDWIVRKRDFAILVAEEEGKPVGFLILEFHYVEESTGEIQSHIYNLSVLPSHFGKWIGHELVREAARVTHQRGYRYMTSKVTASNERALLSAIKLGFEIERYQLTMACGPEGIERMPGRPMEQRGHAVSRLLRTRKRKKQ